MVSISQELWNLLFSWLSEGECMLPEGCTVPPAGLIFYVTLIVLVAVIIHQRERILKSKSDVVDAVWGIFDLV